MSNAEGSAIDQNLNDATGQGDAEEHAPQPEPREDEE